MNGLDLFSGIGGISLALKPWVRTIAYCEQDRYAQGVLLSRMREGSIDAAPIWDDVRTLQPSHFADPVDIIFGGFPCQDISTAGRGAGLGGERSGLFFEIVRLVDGLRPSFVFLENVPAITTRGLPAIAGAFSELRYDCRWTIVSAAELGAPHVRKRWFMLAANAERLDLWKQQRGSGGEGRQNTALFGIDGSEEPVANPAGVGREAGRFSFGAEPQLPVAFGDGENLENAERERLERSKHAQRRAADSIADAGWWSSEPNVGRVVDGLSFRVDRIRCLGNSVVPRAAQKAFKRLSGIEG